MYILMKVCIKDYGVIEKAADPFQLRNADRKSIEWRFRSLVKAAKDIHL